MKTRDRLTLEGTLSDFDEYLRRYRGVREGTRHNYARFVRAFLEAVFKGSKVDLGRIRVRDIVDFVSASTGRYGPATTQLETSSLRSFFRFARATGARADRLEDAVPTVPRRRLTSLPRYLEATQFAKLLASLDGASPLALRDRGILLCVARLGLRASEVARLQLEDIDWRNATVRVVTRKTGHGAMLPLPADLGRALAAYLQQGRPDTKARQVFVLHRQHAGAPINGNLVGDAVKRSLEHAGIDAPMRGSNLLRHSLASELLGHGATMKEIADVMGHSSLVTTSIYASVDVKALREVSLPWPQVTK